MTGEMKLKPCPFCGGKGIISLNRINIEEIPMFFAKCSGSCGAEGRRELSEKDAVSAWNRRAPEPGTSVIRWNRYDGTPETLPKIDDRVLLNDEDIEFSRYIGDRKFMPSWTTILHIEIEIGDLWAYLPEPPEGME